LISELLRLTPMNIGPAFPICLGNQFVFVLGSIDRSQQFSTALDFIRTGLSERLAIDVDFMRKINDVIHASTFVHKDFIGAIGCSHTLSTSCSGYAVKIPQFSGTGKRGRPENQYKFSGMEERIYDFNIKLECGLQNNLVVLYANSDIPKDIEFLTYKGVFRLISDSQVANTDSRFRISVPADTRPYRIEVEAIDQCVHHELEKEYTLILDASIVGDHSRFVGFADDMNRANAVPIISKNPDSMDVNVKIKSTIDINRGDRITLQEFIPYRCVLGETRRSTQHTRSNVS